MQILANGAAEHQPGTSNSCVAVYADRLPLIHMSDDRSDQPVEGFDALWDSEFGYRIEVPDQHCGPAVRVKIGGAVCQGHQAADSLGVQIGEILLERPISSIVPTTGEGGSGKFIGNNPGEIGGHGHAALLGRVGWS